MKATLALLTAGCLLLGHVQSSFAQPDFETGLTLTSIGGLPDITGGVDGPITIVLIPPYDSQGPLLGAAALGNPFINSPIIPTDDLGAQQSAAGNQGLPFPPLPPPFQIGTPIDSPGAPPLPPIFRGNPPPLLPALPDGATTPEPSTLSLVALSAILLLWHFRRSTSPRKSS